MRIPLLAEEGRRDSHRLTRRGGQFGEKLAPRLGASSLVALAAARAPVLRRATLVA